MGTFGAHLCPPMEYTWAQVARYLGDLDCRFFCWFQAPRGIWAAMERFVML